MDPRQNTWTNDMTKSNDKNNKKKNISHRLTEKVYQEAKEQRQNQTNGREYHPLPQASGIIKIDNQPVNCQMKQLIHDKLNRETQKRYLKKKNQWNEKIFQDVEWIKMEKCIRKKKRTQTRIRVIKM